MRSFCFWIICGTLLTIVVTGSASAHDGQPLRTVSQRIGKYPVVINYYNEPRGGQALLFTIHPENSESGNLVYQVTAVPGTTVNAVPVKATLTPDPDRPDGIAGSVSLPVTGQWLLSLKIDGPLGTSHGDVPVLAGPPPAIPTWVGWPIGLIPVWGILAFIAWPLWRSVRSRARPQPAT